MSVVRSQDEMLEGFRELCRSEFPVGTMKISTDNPVTLVLDKLFL